MANIVNENKYSPILRESIRLGVAVPFDCYIYLKINGKMIHFIKADDVPIERTLERLQQKSIDKIYIQTEDFDKYNEYIQSYLDSTEGQDFLQNVDASINVPEIPPELLQKYLERKKQAESFQLGGVFNNLEGFSADEKLLIQEASNAINQELAHVFQEQSKQGNQGKVKTDKPLGVTGKIKIVDVIRSDSVSTNLKEIVSDIDVGIEEKIQKTGNIAQKDIIKIKDKVHNIFKDEVLHIAAHPELFANDNELSLQTRIESKISDMLRDEGLEKGVDLLSTVRSSIKRSVQKIKKDFFVVKGNYGDFENDENNGKVEEEESPKDAFKGSKNGHSKPQKKKYGRVKIAEEIGSKHYKLPSESEQKIFKQLQALKEIAKNGLGDVRIQLLSRTEKFEQNLGQSKTVLNTEEGEDGVFLNRESFEQREQISLKSFAGITNSGGNGHEGEGGNSGGNGGVGVSPDLLQFVNHFKSLYETSPDLQNILSNPDAFANNDVNEKSLQSLQSFAQTIGNLIGQHLQKGTIELPPGDYPTHTTQTIPLAVVSPEIVPEGKKVVDADAVIDQENNGVKKKTLMEIINKQKQKLAELEAKAFGIGMNMGVSVGDVGENQNQDQNQIKMVARGSFSSTAGTFAIHQGEINTHQEEGQAEESNHYGTLRMVQGEEDTTEIESESESESGTVSTEEKNALELELEKWQEGAKKAQEQIDIITQQRDQLINDKESVEKEKKELEKKVKASDILLNQQKKIAESKENEAEKAREHLEEEKKANLAKAKEHKDEKETLLKQAKIEWEQSVKTERDEVKKKEEELERKFSEMKSQQEQIQKELDSATKFREDAEKKYQEYEGFVNTNDNYLSSIEIESKGMQETLEQYKGKIDEEKSRAENVSESSRILEGEVKLKESELTEFKNSLNDLRSQMASKEKTIDDLSRSLQKIEGETDAQHTERAKEKLTNVVAEQNKQIAKLNNQVDGHKDTIRNLNREIVAGKNHNDGVLKLKKKLTEKLAEVEEQKKITKKKEDSLNNKIAMLTNMNNQNRKTIGKLTATGDELRKERSKLSGQITEFDNVKNQMNKTIIKLQQIETQNEIQTKKMQKDNQRLMEKLKELQIKYAGETKKVFELQKKIKGNRYNDSPQGEKSK